MKRKKQNLKDTNKNEKKIENNPPQKSEISQNQKESLVLRHKIDDLIRKEKSESVLKIMTEVVNPYLVAGFGMVLAGNVLNAVKDWPVFTSIPQLLIMVPALLGLKGNLEMTLTARLSTQANLGTFKNRKESIELVVGNLILSQFQSLVVGFLAAVVAVCFGGTDNSCIVMNSTQRFVMMAVSAMITASLASLILGVLMTIVVFTSNHYHINPDNVATPIAGSLGDLVSILLLAVVSSRVYHLIEYFPWVVFLILLFLFCTMPLFVYVCVHNKYTKGVLWGAWLPVISAMVISSLGGLILDGNMSHYEGLALLQPLVNGIGGNLVAIQASRQSTFLHKIGPAGGQGKYHFSFRGCSTCTGAFSCDYLGCRSKRALQLLVVPGHMVFLFVVWLLRGHDVMHLSHVSFVMTYLSVVVVQVSILLAISDLLVPFLWKRNLDPDTCALPYLTALGDVMGILLLPLAFKFNLGAK